MSNEKKFLADFEKQYLMRLSSTSGNFIKHLNDANAGEHLPMIVSKKKRQPKGTLESCEQP